MIPQVGCREGRMHADLTPYLGGRDIVSNRPSAQEKMSQSKSKKKQQKWRNHGGKIL